MIPARYDYHRPASVAEAVALLASLGDEARPIAGGHSLIPMMKLRLAQPAHLVDLGRPRGAAGHPRARPMRSSSAPGHPARADRDRAARRDGCPILRETALQIADPQVRYCGTLGGNVANGDPGNDMPAVMQCLDATYLLHGPDGAAARCRPATSTRPPTPPRCSRARS